jgi:MYXO-CTERM domain-containing protein
MPADVLFQGVQVPAGHHTVRVSYQPAAVTIGALVSGGGVAAIAALLVLGLVTLRRRRKGHDSPLSLWQ